MSFFKKLTKEFEELKTSFSDDKPAEKKDDQHQQYQQQQQQQQQHHQQPQTGERGFGDQPQQQQYGGYGSGAPPSNYPYPSQAQPGYGGQPSYAQTPPPAPQAAAPPMAAPSVSSGWLVQWDTNNNRWFYVDQSTGRSQWEHPSPPTGGQGGSSYAPPPVPPHPSSHTIALRDQGYRYRSTPPH
ncbi:hypothetical protein CLIM01_12936 [Colletotrichum limetticola]|uniref:WW domain-containing protein n=1 Tax=Colletotrichum limetticola TaxID=1209924 RepID=A0ABQ9PC61_9PEZI|nr:hypothetical protein CLIM01_12936 [Colletotrichum limetticola]